MKSPIFNKAGHVPANLWKWPHFKPSEIASHDGPVMWDTDAMDKLETLRNLMGKPLVILSAYRTPAHNAEVGGAPHSKHMLAEAFDIRLEGHDRANLEDMAKVAGFTGIGHYPTFLHFDIGPPRQWWHDGKVYVTEDAFKGLNFVQPLPEPLKVGDRINLGNGVYMPFVGSKHQSPNLVKNSPAPAPDQDAAKEDILDDLGALFGGAKIANKLKRKRAAA